MARKLAHFADSSKRPVRAALLGFVLCACTGQSIEVISLRVDDGATEAMLNIARAAQDCWFQGDPSFSAYRLANEVNSPAGRPRILLVPKSDPGALPLLVVQAERKGGSATGAYTDIQTYGPILSSGAGKRITDDVTRWSRGETACG